MSSSRAPAWSPVFAPTLCVGTLIASEFMPVSLLTPIAASLHISEGWAGEAIAVSGLFAVITNLTISTATRGIDRRTILLALTLLMVVSGVMIAFAPSAAAFMAGRALVGVVIGGFWSMSAATVMRLVPAPHVGWALALLNRGNALATTIAAQGGSFSWPLHWLAGSLLLRGPARGADTDLAIQNTAAHAVWPCWEKRQRF